MRYLTARFFDRDTAALLFADLDAAEMDREAVGVDRRQPLEICNGRDRLVSRNAQVRHFALPSGVLFRSHEEPRHRLFSALGSGDRDPGVPGGVEPSLGEIGGVVRAVTHEGVTIDAGAALNHELALLDKRCGLGV